jgi:hypothetical protein
MSYFLFSIFLIFIFHFSTKEAEKIVIQISQMRQFSHPAKLPLCMNCITSGFEQNKTWM